MDQVNRQFVPHVLVVQQGQTVRFPNSDDTRHHVYSFSEAKIFEVKLFKGTNSDPIVMDKAGIVELGCNIHDMMLGYIYVSSSGQAVKTKPDGTAEIDVELPVELKVWHPRMPGNKAQHHRFTLDSSNESSPKTLSITLAPIVEETRSRGFSSKFKRSENTTGD